MIDFNDDIHDVDTVEVKIPCCDKPYNIPKVHGAHEIICNLHNRKFNVFIEMNIVVKNEYCCKGNKIKCHLNQKNKQN